MYRTQARILVLLVFSGLTLIGCRTTKAPTTKLVATPNQTRSEAIKNFLVKGYQRHSAPSLTGHEHEYCTMSPVATDTVLIPETNQAERVVTLNRQYRYSYPDIRPGSALKYEGVLEVTLFQLKDSHPFLDGTVPGICQVLLVSDQGSGLAPNFLQLQELIELAPLEEPFTRLDTAMTQAPPFRHPRRGEMNQAWSSYNIIGAWGMTPAQSQMAAAIMGPVQETSIPQQK